MNDLTLADQDWIGLMIFKKFVDQHWIGFNFIGSGLDSDWKNSQSVHLCTADTNSNPKIITDWNLRTKSSNCKG